MDTYEKENFGFAPGKTLAGKACVVDGCDSYCPGKTWEKYFELNGDEASTFISTQNTRCCCSGNEIFKQMSHVVVGQGSANGGFQTTAPAQAAGDVVFAAAFPNLEFAGTADATFARIKPQHDFAERNHVVLALGHVPQLNWHNFVRLFENREWIRMQPSENAAN